MNARILYLSPYFWPEEIGSSPYSTDLAVWLKQLGHDIQVVAFRPHYPSPEKFGAWADGSRDYEMFKNIPISRVSIQERSSGGVLSRLKNDFSYLWFIVRNALAGHFSGTTTILVYVPSILGVYGALIIKSLTKARLIVIVHDIESGLARSVGLVQNRAIVWGMRLLEKIGLNGADHIAVLTDGMKQALNEIGCTKPIELIPIWTELAPEVPLKPSGLFKIAYSGNFGKKQNLFQLLPAFELISIASLPVMVTLRGEGSEKEALKRAIENRGIRNIIFEGLAPKEQLFSALQAADIHLVPQALGVANYALPSKLFSIMSAGRPFLCIAEKDTALDIIARESGAGLCVQPSETGDTLFKAIQDLMNDSSALIRMGEAGRRYVSEHMDRTTILKKFSSLI